MNISNTPAVQSATAGAQSTPDGLSALVLRKALNTQANAAAELIQSLPPVQPGLASSGSLGTQLNTYA
ncbi:putative motility protein [Curvibacter sp. RS43]|uniref:putative motility protein n=1 Tax=Curvibacter microcysteis TaxID=3026419 RepID=UPI00235E56D9|nr:putative motility protein [Curvibacter sp. RS43]MDD0809763.1 putative motility protein [Curvibacter sp. RS43]